MQNEIIWVKDDLSKEIPQVLTPKIDSDTVTVFKKPFIIFSLSLMCLGVLFAISGLLLSHILRNNEDMYAQIHKQQHDVLIENDYVISFGSFKRFNLANIMVQKLMNQHKYDTEVINIDGLFYVVSKEKYDSHAANKKINELKSHNIYCTLDKI
ncbi:hypothetical protein [Candidatus Gromoviella agglomerans]|uniref:hypothetical protein n=1 Tax=Candidatus Gromoviella agglomerans TaxID=2806609 RepID=UPI001E57E6D3|nr:hypothetical protein [Candidatus Gromoviella agglomerans]UFX98284.1 hypothetical protein Gromo_00169 [Candidatus Gromoviella agglomerans]